MKNKSLIFKSTTSLICSIVSVPAIVFLALIWGGPQISIMLAFLLPLTLFIGGPGLVAYGFGIGFGISSLLDKERRNRLTMILAGASLAVALASLIFVIVYFSINPIVPAPLFEERDPSLSAALNLFFGF